MIYKNIAIASLVVSLISPQLRAQGSSFIGQSRVTIALTKSQSTPGIDAKDEVGAVITPKTKVYSNYFMDAKGAEINEGIATITKSRFSNLEFLRYVLSREREKNDPESVMKSVVGWSLIFAYDADGEIDGFYIQRKIRGNKLQVINVSEYLSEYEDGGAGSNVDVQNDRVLQINDIYTRSFAEFGVRTLRLDPVAFLTKDQREQYVPEEEFQGYWGITIYARDLFSLKGVRSTDVGWNQNKMLEATKTDTISNLIGGYEYIDAIDYEDETESANVLVNGSISSSVSTFINAERFYEGLNGGSAAIPQ